MAVIATASINKSVADPCFAYESINSIWMKNRAICSGERFTKDYDGLIDSTSFSNLLIPFSPSMTLSQYNFYKAEAELPGLVSLYLKFIVGGLLRKQPHLELPENIPEEVKTWILDEFSQDASPLSSFLQDALTEEIQTSRAWVFVDYPVIENAEELTSKDFKDFKPYPILQKAENIINWRVRKGNKGEQLLDRVIVRCYEEDYTENEFHPQLKDTVFVHELDDSGFYRIRKFISEDTKAAPYVVQGQIRPKFSMSSGKFKEVEVNENILFNGKRLDFIPAWPLNGSIEIQEPFISPLVDREVSLYNKMSRRNHLLYGASSYTPVITADIGDEQFQAIVDSGLGSWIKLPMGGTATVLNTPTEALKDMEVAIAATIEEMAKMGIRMLSPETSESGIALEIRNAGQTATLGTLNTKVSNTLATVIAFMINWRFDLDLSSSDIVFSLSADFNPAPLGADWLRLCTEWYQSGLIPRTVWLQILKQNDILPGDYNDKEAVGEINSDEFIMPSTPGRLATNAAIQGNAERANMEASGILDQVQNQN